MAHLAHTPLIHVLVEMNTLEDRANTDLLKMMFKRAQMPKYQDKRNLQTRSHAGPRLVIPNYKRTISQRAFVYRGPTHWNELDSDIRSIKSYDAFSNFQKKGLTQIINV